MSQIYPHQQPQQRLSPAFWNRLPWIIVVFLLAILHWTVAPSFLLSNNDYSRIMIQQEDDTVIEKSQDAPTDPCASYDGVLHIKMGDEGAAAATMFFIYVVNHLIYAEMYNLLPWIHLDGTSHRVYDAQVHGQGGVSFEMVRMQIRNGDHYVPRGPRPPNKQQQQPELIQMNGNGVWDSYFEPVSEFNPRLNHTCWNHYKPLYEIDYDGVSGGLHLESDWGVRAWVYGNVKKPDRKLTIRDWYRPKRQRGAGIVRRYIRPQTWIAEAADRANPLLPGQQCVAMHVRRTDMDLSGGRGEVAVQEYLPHVKAFLRRVGDNAAIYLATDSSKTLRELHKTWPTELADRVRTQENVLRSKTADPVFDLASHHRTNTEVLIDIYAMAKCSMLIHGRSAVSEAVQYINPDLREVSIDVEDDKQIVEDLGYWD